MDKLKKCPCCGGEAAVWIGEMGYWIQCEDCGLMTAICTTEEGASELWNKRYSELKYVGCKKCEAAARCEDANQPHSHLCDAAWERRLP